MNRRDILKFFPTAFALKWPLLGATDEVPEHFDGSPNVMEQMLQEHPVVNLDDHGVDMPSGMDMASDEVLRAQAFISGKAQPVETRSGGNLRYGVYPDSTLTAARLAKQPPRKLFTVQLPGDARGLEAQPLIAPSIKLRSDGSTHDLLICATMGNQVYAHDANDGTPLWMTWLGSPVQGSTKIDGWRINDKWGVLSTPVIDGGLMFVVSWTSVDGSAANGRHQIHVIDLATGTQPRPPLLLCKETTTMQRKQRASLTLVGGNCYVPWGTIQETATGAHGFITSVDVVNWKVKDEWCSTPTGSGGGIWMAGQGLSTDGKFLYFMTGNGDYDGKKNFGESFVKLSLDFSTVDHWSPFKDADRGGRGYQDMDLGAGGCICIPDKRLIVGAGKDGVAYVLSMDNLVAGPVTTPIFFTFNGLGLTGADGQSVLANGPVQRLDQLFYGKTHHMHSTPVYVNGQLICWGENGNGRLWNLGKDGKLDFVARTEEFASPYSPASPGGMPGAMMCASISEVARSVVLWAIVPDGDANRQVTTARVFAFDLVKMGDKMADGDVQLRRLWMSDPHHVDNKFCPPVVSGGKLYVATYGAGVDVYA